MAKWSGGRVTRLSDFSPLVRLFTLASGWKIKKVILGLLFPTAKVMY
jgi:hypothetical protein